MAQRTEKETKIIARDRELANMGNFSLAALFGLIAGLFAAIAAGADASQQIGIICFGAVFLAVSAVSAFESGFRGFLAALLGNIAGMSFFILLAWYGRGLAAAVKIFLLCAESLAIALLFIAIAAIILKISAMILAKILNRAEPALNQIGKYLENKINKTNGNP